MVHVLSSFFVTLAWRINGPPKRNRFEMVSELVMSNVFICRGQQVLPLSLYTDMLSLRSAREFFLCFFVFLFNLLNSRGVVDGVVAMVVASASFVENKIKLN